MNLKLSQESISETSFFISRISVILILHLILKAVLPNTNKLPLIITVLLSTTVLKDTAMFHNIRNKIYKYAYEINEVKDFKIDSKRSDLINAVIDLNSYLTNAQKWNNRHRLLYRQMSQLQQNLTRKIKYPQKLNQIDKYLAENDKVVKKIVKSSIAEFDIKDYELKLIELKSKNNGYHRVVESLCHYSRDWSSLGSDEIDPLLKYIESQCKDLNPDKTLAVVPGSGLGRVAHHVATKLKFSSVHAVEFSWLMVLMNKFIYSQQNDKQLEVYPYLHTYSNHVSTKDQIRGVKIQNSIEQPSNLQIHHGDFTKFGIDNDLLKGNKCENLVFVTCYFLDTAENLIEYFQAINRISSQFKGTKKWINLGPLKYGTAAKIELSHEELKEVVQNMGWEFIDEQKPELLGYLTDKKGLWQGYYNVMKWTAKKRD